MSLTDEQRRHVRTFLTGQGLTFQPLLEEMIDHVSSDLEMRMSEGLAFDEAWQKTFNELGEHHFKAIQKETMESINRRFTVSRLLSVITLGLLLIAQMFKVLHLKGASEMLILAFATLVSTLLYSSLSGIYLNREKKGGTRVLAVVVGIGLMATAIGFRLLHLPGADELIVLGVSITVVALIVNAVYVYTNASGTGNLLTFLHEKYSPGIERFFLFLLLPVTILRLATLFSPGQEFVGGIISLIVIFGAGLQLVALSWRAMENDLSKRSTATLTATIVSGMLLTLVFLGPILPVELRVCMIMVYTIVSGWLAYTMETERKQVVSIAVAPIVPVIFLGWGLIRLSLLPPTSYPIFFNLPVMALMIVAIFLSRKNETMRTYAIVSFASYLFEYPANSNPL